ncbi:sulfate/molybdate ABC transporter ATP-binding protein [Alkalihalobacillus sp. BA299]|uniref:sulfate/molybdate ABC transporter ATP-binding protein n=1 Tax=Alkalihalobacillus sp. BA299 TaxID=2815938 RepID=UPI001ADC1EE1|nr:ATP-binding cassette domain-containing protein [Alkalihalobacillus sp. BA299]
MLDVSIKKQLASFSLDVSFRVENGITAILGPSGCGKSLTLQCLAGLQTPDNGKIILQDRTLFDFQNKKSVKSRNRNIGYVFQNYALFPHLTVKNNIGFGLKKTYKKTEIEEKVAIMMEKIQLTGYENHYPNQLSGGQQQRVALGRTLITNPDLLLLDEPFSALDHHIKQLLEQELLSIIQENYSGVVLLVTHNMEEAYRLADKILLLKQGKVIQFGEKYKLFQRPQSVAAAQIIGCKNIFQIHSLKKGNEQIACTVHGLTLTLNKKDFKKHSTHIAIHAENIRFANDENKHTVNTFDFEVTEVIPGINQTQVMIKTGSLNLQTIVPNSKLNEALTSRKVVLPIEHLFLLTQ